MGRTVADLAMLLSVQAGFDARTPLAIDQDPAQFTRSLQRDFKGTRIGWMGDFNGYLPTEPGVMALCKDALRNFATIGCTVEEVQPDFAPDRLWRTWLALRGFLVAGVAAPLYADEKTRALMKPEAVWEVENGLKRSGADVWRASSDRSAWYQALHALFQRVDYLVLPTAQVFPFEARLDWPKAIAGKTMDTYHRWMEVVIGGTLVGVPVINVPAGFSLAGMPMGLQILAPAQKDLAVLQIAYAWEQATSHTKKRSPLLA